MLSSRQGTETTERIQETRYKIISGSSIDKISYFLYSLATGVFPKPAGLTFRNITHPEKKDSGRKDDLNGPGIDVDGGHVEYLYF